MYVGQWVDVQYTVRTVLYESNTGNVRANTVRHFLFSKFCRSLKLGPWPPERTLNYRKFFCYCEGQWVANQLSVGRSVGQSGSTVGTTSILCRTLTYLSSTVYHAYELCLFCRKIRLLAPLTSPSPVWYIPTVVQILVSISLKNMPGTRTLTCTKCCPKAVRAPDFTWYTALV